MLIRFITIILAIFMAGSHLPAQELPDYFEGKIISEGKKPAWAPNGRHFAFANDNKLYIYDIEKQKSKKVLDLKSAEHHWINADSLLAIAWPENVTAREETLKIVTYWIITPDGKKSLFAADSSMTSGIPDFRMPFRLPDGSLAAKKNPGWKIEPFKSASDFVVFNADDVNTDSLINQFLYATTSDQEGGSIHLKGSDKQVRRTISVGQQTANAELSPDYNYIYADIGGTARILDFDGTEVVNLNGFIDSSMVEDFQSIFGATWAPSSKGILYYEIYKTPQDFYTINYFDLETGKKYTITRSGYYGRNDIFISPDREYVLAHEILEGQDYVALCETGFNPE